MNSADATPDLPRCTILFVDDEPHILGGLQDALRRYPFTVLTALSGALALKLLEVTPVDVVVSDERMPNMRGSEFLSLVRQRYPETIRIMLTGQASLAAAIQAINEGEVYRFLTKPYSAARLATTIRAALQVRGVRDESAAAKVREQGRLLRDLEGEHPGISKVKRSDDGAIVLEEAADIDELVRQLTGE